MNRPDIESHRAVVCNKNGYETLDEADSARSNYEEFYDVGRRRIVLVDGRYYVVCGDDYVGGYPGPYEQ